MVGAAPSPDGARAPSSSVRSSDGQLGGFGGGSLLKQALLTLEGVETGGTGCRLAPPDRDLG